MRKRNALRYIVGGNFLLFVCAVRWLGGDPVQGGLINGRYYLGYHHRYVEVTENLFSLMAVYMSLTFMSMFVAAIVLVSTKRD